MASKGAFENKEGIPIIRDAFIVLVKTEWNQDIVDILEEGCIEILKSSSIKFTTLVVPGAIEIPFAIRAHSTANHQRVEAYIALGAVIRGDTPHFDYVCSSVTQGITLLNIQLDVPVIFGVLTVNNQSQAIERLGGEHGHKGKEAALTALKMITLNRRIKEQATFNIEKETI